MVTLLFLIGIALSNASIVRGSTLTTVTVPAAFREGNDFATRVLGDPWDMSSYGDISHYLNESGQRKLVVNPTVANGVFSGTSFGSASTTGSPYFFPLFPGYKGESDLDPVSIPVTDRIGYNYPIPSATNHCLYVSLNSQSSSSDYMWVLWFADRTLNISPDRYGGTYVQLYPGGGAPFWQVIKVDLAATPPLIPNTNQSWTSHAQWQGLRIDPTTTAAGTNFAVDWVRLTDCTALNQTISWTPDASVTSIWLQPVGTTRNIRLVTGLNGASGTASVDFQGVAAGSYYVGMGTTTSCCSQMSAQPITINLAPTGKFVTPSYTSGVDYATQAGNSWDFDPGRTDGNVIQFTSGTPLATATYDGNGMLLTTPSGPLPAGVDVAINLNTPQAIDPNAYRYLTVDMETSWVAPWENIPDAMIGRWIWATLGTSGNPGSHCTMVGPDIPYDIGRQQMTVDLFSTLSGNAEDREGECAGGTLSWRTGQVLTTRFDPNENISILADPTTGGGPLIQRIRSIQLNKPNTVNKSSGTYVISLGLNKDPSLVNTSFYYTTTTASPTQYPALAMSPPADMPNKVYLPLIQRAGVAQATSGNMKYFSWDLSTVPLGTYYICAVLNDGLNSQTSCSMVPITVQ